MKLNREEGVKDFKWAVELNQAGFGFIGVWPNVGSVNGLKVSSAILYVALVVTAPQMYSLVLSRKNFDLILEILLTNLECTAAVIKFITLWYNKKALIPILDSLANDWQTMTSGWQQNIMSDFGRQGRLLGMCGYVFCIVTLIAYAVLPAVGFSMHSEIANVTNLNGRYLPLPSMYPYDLSSSPYFELCCASQVIGGGLVGLGLTGPITLFGVIVLHVCGQIEILKTALKSLSKRSTEEPKHQSTINQNWKPTLGEIIKKHQDIIKTVSNVENYFNILIITDVITLPVTLCTIGYQIMNVVGSGAVETSNMGQYLSLLVNLALILLHVFIYCFVGELLASYSNSLRHSVYETKWYTYNYKKAKNLIPILLKTKHPLKLTAGKYLVLNLDTFCKVLKTVAGYISMLLAVAGK